MVCPWHQYIRRDRRCKDVDTSADIDARYSTSAPAGHRQ